MMAVVEGLETDVLIEQLHRFDILNLGSVSDFERVLQLVCEQRDLATWRQHHVDVHAHVTNVSCAPRRSGIRMSPSTNTRIDEASTLSTWARSVGDCVRP